MAGPPLLHCFAPVVAPDTRVLILGSLPGAASLAAGRYYAHPQNQFWRLLEPVIREPLQALPYEERLDCLLAHGIGLWDTVASAQRSGSLDAGIRLHAASDLRSLVETLPSLKAIGFNGGTSARIGRRELGDAGSPDLLDLPSSSPAYTIGFAMKAEVWVKLAAYL